MAAPFRVGVPKASNASEAYPKHPKACEARKSRGGLHQAPGLSWERLALRRRHWERDSLTSIVIEKVPIAGGVSQQLPPHQGEHVHIMAG